VTHAHVDDGDGPHGKREAKADADISRNGRQRRGHRVDGRQIGVRPGDIDNSSVGCVYTKGGALCVRN